MSMNTQTTDERCAHAAYNAYLVTVTEECTIEAKYAQEYCQEMYWRSAMRGDSKPDGRNTYVLISLTKSSPCARTLEAAGSQVAK